MRWFLIIVVDNADPRVGLIRNPYVYCLQRWFRRETRTGVQPASTYIKAGAGLRSMFLWTFHSQRDLHAPLDLALWAPAPCATFMHMDGQRCGSAHRHSD